MALFGLPWLLMVFTSSDRSSAPVSPNVNRSGSDLISIVNSEDDHYRLIIETYPNPERNESTENDVPRPLIITRFIEYKPEGVKLALIPKAKLGDLPPFEKWKLFGAIDTRTETKLTYPEAVDRLRQRAR